MMREYNIKTEPFKFISILALDIMQEINRHGDVKIEGYVADENEEDYLKLLMRECWVKIEAIGKEKNTKVLFWGLVKGFELGEDNDQKKLKLEIISGSWLMDRNKHIRGFQNTGQTYSEIFKQLVLPYKDSGFISNISLDNPLGEFILQYQETDWEFLMRIASKSNQFLTSECLSKGVKIYAGLPKTETITINQETRYTTFKELKQDNSKIYESMGYIIKLREAYGIGTAFILSGKEALVYKIESSYQNGEMLHTYFLKKKDDIQAKTIYLEKAQGVSLEGTVMEVKEDKVKVCLLKDENKGSISNSWFLFSTIYASETGTGWYCMPEINEKIRLYIPGREENAAYAISAVYNQPEKGERNNPDNKILKTKYGKEIRLTPDEIVITNNQGLRIELLDGKGINIISNKAVVIEAGGDMTISSGKGSIIMAADSSLTMKQQGTEISLKDGIKFAGGEFRIQ